MKPPGSLVKLTYDSPREVDVGDVLFTPTGRAYRIESVRRQRGGIRAGRWHLMCLVLAETVDELDEDVVRHPIHWYARGRHANQGAGRIPTQSLQ